MDEQPEPLPVSVVIPAHDRAELIGRAVASALAQRPRPPAEVVVVDDASSDATGEAAAAAGARVVRHDRNRGEAGARNTGLEVASQPWIALLDSDDEWLPHHLDTLWRLRGDHVLVADAMLRCGEDPSGDRYHGAVADEPVVLRSPAALVFPQNFVNPSATMLRRDAGLRAGGYRPGYGTDLHFLLRLLEQGTGLATPRVGGLYHVHGGQMTQDVRPFQEGLRAMLRGYAGRPWWSADQYARLEVVHVWDDLRLALRDGDRGRAAAHARWLVRRPRRLAALARMWRWRLGGRRRSGRTDRAGRPTLALLPGASGAPPADRSGVVDLRDGSLRSALARLARRPTAAAVPGAPVHRPLLRAIGVRAVRPPSPSAQDGTGATT